MKDRSWTLEQGIETVRKLESVVRPLGFYTGITGSVLYKGRSEKDLDITIVPLDASKPIDLPLLHLTLHHALGWVCTHHEPDIKKIWRAKGSTDIKHVEAWKTPEGKRVDIMVLK